MDPGKKSEVPGGGFTLMGVLVVADLYNTQVLGAYVFFIFFVQLYWQC
jgi:hypothetical protein